MTVYISVTADIFSACGLTERLVSNNGHQFVSHDYTNFMKMNLIKYTNPYDPASNGAAERCVQILQQYKHFASK